MKIARVGFDVPLDTLFDYRCDGAGATPADIGARVLAPFGKRNAVGVILALAILCLYLWRELRKVRGAL